MDVFVLEGDSILFRVALTILEILEARLLNPDKEEVERVLSGQDKGARSIVLRDTISIYGERTIEQVSVDETYEEMGCEEDQLLNLLTEQNWNESLWERLVSRELPD
ncbi:hypothetical protein O181_074208 [Austropuccinia psidii MF-1]|uniref:Uncharacterized protein n=1 Tax=Austropuccinia psidii MF-1 TaxID=1389203 RepID=A0A9Q3FAL1_9BASI|nr:hypothetical protein [Austropuccinia psidii MF-1]